MKRFARILVPSLVILCAFYAWHMPLRGALTDAEIDAFLARQDASGGDIWTDEDAFEAFLRVNDGRPFVMINPIELRGEAIYPNGSAEKPKPRRRPEQRMAALSPGFCCSAAATRWRRHGAPI